MCILYHICATYRVEIKRAANPHPSSDRSAPCGTTLATAFGSDLRSVDTLRDLRFALRQPDDFVAGESCGSAYGLGICTRLRSPDPAGTDPTKPAVLLAIIVSPSFTPPFPPPSRAASRASRSQARPPPSPRRSATGTCPPAQTRQQ